MLDVGLAEPQPDPLRSMVPGVVIGVVFALVGLGGVWAWQAWSNRVSEPIDDRLPMLFATGPELDETAATPTTTQEHAWGMSPSPSVQHTTDGVAPPVMEIVVHVSGAVNAPGVVELAAGSRLVDALSAAGGPSDTADLDRVNLAALAVDGERIHVPSIGEEVAPSVVAPSRTSTHPSTPTSPDEALHIDINAASTSELQALPGVGPSIAREIVRTRESRGPFMSVDELLDVPGIGESKLTQLEPHVFVAG